MTLNFEKIILHNFGSYGHTELSLNDRGFCLVSGQNNFKKDNAKSNGSGKSFIWSGICFALTGETIQGLTSNLKNVYIDEKSCYVSLTFKSDTDSYVVTRYIEPKSDLKIEKNGTDISGKGLRDSEKKLGEILPDLTKDLIASCIIIGQGMPNKFSSRSPSGRKDLLEQLTKSDFMIEDIKNRVAARQATVNASIRASEDNLLVNKTKLATNQGLLNAVKSELENQVKPDFDNQIKESEDQLAAIKVDWDKAEAAVKALRETDKNLNEDLVKAAQNKSNELNQHYLNNSGTRDALYKQATEVYAKLSALTREIKAKEAITDICPTCGQKLNGVHKPDTTALKAESQTLTEEYKRVNGEYNSANQTYDDGIKAINTKYDEEATRIRKALGGISRDLNQALNDSADYEHYYKVEAEKLSQLKYNKANWDKHQTELASKKAQYEQEENQLSNLIRMVSDNLIDLQAHQAVLNKMETLIKRDFRGYLLTNVISYLDTKAKDYCEIVFGTRDLNVYLDGNALDIAYGNKLIDNLSGGEKMRVDLILQLSIRDLLCKYFNFSSNIIVLDEITDFLDSQSCNAVMNLLSTTLTDIESVFVISHHADELNLPVDSEIRVVKSPDGISEIQ